MGRAPTDLDGCFYRFASYPGAAAFKKLVMEKKALVGNGAPVPARVLTMTHGPIAWSEFVSGEISQLVLADAACTGARGGGDDREDREAR